MKTVNILNLPIDNLSKVELLKSLKRGGIVFTPNVDHLMKLQNDQEFYQAYEVATYRVCDSQIVMYASKFLGTPLKEKISGSDLFPAFYQYYKDDPNIRIFLLGSSQEAVTKAQENINRKVGRNIIVASHSPSYGFEQNEKECREIVAKINQSNATVLAIGVGAPKQEKWILKYKDRLPKIKTFLSIGATIDFEAGAKPRSPQWMSNLGLEWLYRLSTEPQRLWKRYLVDDMPFLWLILKQKLNSYRIPLTKERELLALESKSNHCASGQESHHPRSQSRVDRQALAMSQKD